MKTDKELANKVLQIYFRKVYIMGDRYKLTQDEIDFIENNEFKVIVTEKTKNNGYDSDKQRVAEMLELNKPYILKNMDVGRSSSTIELQDYPGVYFNSVNFEFLALDYDFIKVDYDKVVKEIEGLHQEKQRLEKIMFDRADDFITKFRVWWFNDDECHLDSIPSHPIMRKMIEDHDYRRGETIDLERIIGDDELAVITYSYEEYEPKHHFDDEDEYNRELERLLKIYKPLLEEAMNNDIKSFKLDW